MAIAIWDLFLVGVPLAIAAILAFNNWPLANIWLLLGGVFLAELFFVLVPASFYAPGPGPTNVGVAGPRQPTYDEFIAAADEKRASVGIPVGLDPIAIGPAIALLVIVVSFAISH